MQAVVFIILQIFTQHAKFENWFIFNNYWTRFSKISWCDIIYLRDTNKSRYFAIIQFNNCFIIRSPSLFSYFNHSLQLREAIGHFFRERGSNYAWAEYYLQQNTFRWYLGLQRYIFLGHDTYLDTSATIRYTIRIVVPRNNGDNIRFLLQRSLPLGHR